MPKLQLIKEPGFVFDLLTIFTLWFNKRFFSGKVLAKNQDEHEKHCDEVINKFGEISEDLFLFFHVLDGHHNFISTFYFKKFSVHFFEDYDVDFLLKTISDRRAFIENIIKFYLQDITDHEREKCLASVVDLFSYVKASSHPDNIKKKLYEFFINPDYYVQILQYELMKKSLLLETYYSEHYDVIMDAYNRITLDVLNLRFREKSNATIARQNETGEYISFCLVNRECANVFVHDKSNLFLMGYAFDATDCEDASRGIDLEQLGSALCEESRVKILRLLNEEGALTCKDLEKAFEFSGSTAYHHATLLVRSGAVKTHNEGKIIYYSINRDYFDAVIKVLGEYSNKK
jgi:DNA-binding transcriptional ArsR family regulator